MTKAAKMTKATKYLLDRAASDNSGRIASLIVEIARHNDLGDVVLAEQSMRTLEDFVYSYTVPYTISDILAASEVV